MLPLRHDQTIGIGPALPKSACHLHDNLSTSLEPAPTHKLTPALPANLVIIIKIVGDKHDEWVLGNIQ